jgi:guanylate kinase
LSEPKWEELPGRLFVVSGPSGAGKSTIARRIVEQGQVRARLSVSATTRLPRGSEVAGVDYEFLSKDEFEGMRDRGEFLEWAEVHGHLYGTPIGPIRRALAEGNCVILVIDVQGGQFVRRRVPNAALVFLHAPSLDVLEARLRARGTDDEATVRRRLENARREIALAEQHYPIHIVNDDIDVAVRDLASLMARSGCGG